mmetsp:Transcript_26809/g.29892  ORF Transcript_26809/g.29892 Transcript_26809/m.29892 type:complete len:159 (+) Transcript_26809:201-677(+)
MRSTVLSNESVINYINAYFVPVAVNVTRQGFPSEIPAMKMLEMVYKRNWRFAFGFASCGAFDDQGKISLGHSSPVKDEMQNGFFGVTSFLNFLQKSLKNFYQTQQIRQRFRNGDIRGGMAALQQLTRQRMIETRLKVNELMTFQRQLQTSGFGNLGSV